MMGFSERLDSSAAANFAVASVHFSFGFSTESDAIEGKGIWAGEVANRLEKKFPDADMYFIGGDFNEVRCRNAPGAPVLYGLEAGLDEPADSGPDEEGDQYVESLVCSERETHAKLAGKGFVEAVYAANARTSRSLKDDVDLHSPLLNDTSALSRFDTLNRQYLDGDRVRQKRIDHIFVKGATTSLAASYDLTCGQVADARASNCKWLQNPERYSDHRMVWALAGINPKPSQDLVEPPQIRED
jgi:hypothetical protein